MGIKSTSYISRQEIIDRIELINELIQNEDYRGIVEASGEYDYGTKHLISFVNKGVEHRNVSKYTNTMLEDIMDEPYYRYSMFDNYLIRESNEEDDY